MDEQELRIYLLDTDLNKEITDWPKGMPLPDAGGIVGYNGLSYFVIGKDYDLSNHSICIKVSR